MTVTVTPGPVKLTPQLAAEWLEGGHGGSDGELLAYYVREMQEGRWRPGSIVVRSTQTGRILDGLTRVRAVLVSGVTIDVGVVPFP